MWLYQLRQVWRQPVIRDALASACVGCCSGEHATLAALADAERISRGHVRRVLRLTLLAPDLAERRSLSTGSGSASGSLRATAIWPGPAKPEGMQVRLGASA
jgi:hypothetical protein